MMRVIGLDLTTSPQKGTAYAVLTQKVDIVTEGLVAGDEEIIALAEEQRPALMAIDAPPSTSPQQMGLAEICLTCLKVL